MTRKPIVAVVGAATVTEDIADIAYDVGQSIARAGWNLLCGGGQGVMLAACRGFAEARQLESQVAVGILPSDDADFANEYVDVAIPTGLGWARNAVVARAGDAMIAVAGGSGTLSELAYAWQMQKPIVVMGDSGGWSAELAGRCLDDRRRDPVLSAATGSEAAALLEKTFGR